jgi:hypothetical protein
MQNKPKILVPVNLKQINDASQEQKDSGKPGFVQKNNSRYSGSSQVLKNKLFTSALFLLAIIILLVFAIFE